MILKPAILDLDSLRLCRSVLRGWPTTLFGYFPVICNMARIPSIALCRRYVFRSFFNQLLSTPFANSVSVGSLFGPALSSYIEISRLAY